MMNDNDTTDTDFTEVFHQATHGDARMHAASGIVEHCASGTVWLIGGAVYRPLVQKLYGSTEAPKDYDFIVEGLVEEKLPQGWERSRTKLGGHRLQRDGITIDIALLQNLHPFIRRGDTPAMDDYLDETPLTVQSLYYNITDGILVGDIGLQAIKEKIVAPHCREELLFCGQLGNIDVNDYIVQKAESIGFEPVLLDETIEQ